MVCPRRGAQCAPKVRLKRRRGSCPCITGRVSPPAGGGTVSLRATGAHTRRSGRPASNRRIAAALSESEATFLSVRGGHTDNTHQRTKGPPSRRPLRKQIASMQQKCSPGRALRAPTGYKRSVWCAEVVAQASLARRVVALASLSCRCAAIHLLAPYREVLQFSPRPYWVAALPQDQQGLKAPAGPRARG